MSIEIKDFFIQGKYQEKEKCEDRIVFSDRYICIIDGATSKSDLIINDNSTGRIVGEILQKAIENITQDFSCNEMARFLTQQVYQFYLENNLLQRVTKNPRDRLIASAIIYNIKRGEIWLIGDCQCLLDDIHYTNTNLIDLINANTRSLILQLNIAKGKTIEELMIKDLGRDFILPILKEQQIFQNSFLENPMSYSVIDGFEMDIKKIKILDVKKTKTIIMASDGYPLLFQSLRESEKYLKELLKKDPLCYKIYKSTKGLMKGNNSYDDRAYIKIANKLSYPKIGLPQNLKKKTKRVTQFQD